MIDFQCKNPNCTKRFSVKEEFAGKPTKCPNCKTPLIVPQPNGTMAAQGTAMPASTGQVATPQPRYYYMQNNQRMGPVDLNYMRQQIANRQIQPTDLVWREGGSQWVEVKVVPEFASAQQPPSPTPQPVNPPRHQVTPAPQRPPSNTGFSQTMTINPSDTQAMALSGDGSVSKEFGMTRLIYWSSFIGGWCALIGWGLAEIFFGGSWIDDNQNFFGQLLVIASMTMFVACAIGAGLSQVEALSTSQWQAQLKQLLPGLLGGLAGGLCGGLLGMLLFSLLGNINDVLGFFARLLGWTLLGTSIGICDGLLRKNWQRFRNGLIGGTLGGLLGGLAFNPVEYIVGSPVSSRALSFVILGLLIGLFIGLVQVLLKEAWITVEAGFRPGRQLILNDTITTMGTSEKASLIFIAYGAKGVEPLHLQIRRDEDGTFYLEDNNSRSGTFLNGQRITGPQKLNSGDVIKFGVNEVKFQEQFKSGTVKQE